MSKAPKKIVLSVGDVDLEFSVGMKEYEDFQNELVSNKGVSGPSKTLLRRTIKAEQKDALLELLEDGHAVDLAGLLLSEFRPKVEISVKKSTSSLPD